MHNPDTHRSQAGNRHTYSGFLTLSLTVIQWSLPPSPPHQLNKANNLSLESDQSFKYNEIRFWDR